MITWTVNIGNVNIAKKSADISFSRVDDVAVTTENYRFTQAIIETTAQKLALLDSVWQKHLDKASNQTAIDAIVSNLEQAAKANLEEREV